MGSGMHSFGPGFAGALKRELGRMLGQPVLLVFAVFVPVALLLFMFFLYGAAVPRELPVALCDQDNSSLSRQVVRAIEATPSVRLSQRVLKIGRAHV